MSDTGDFLEELMPHFLWDYMAHPVCVAGGCLRDAWFDKPIKDVDVFIGVHEDVLKEFHATGSFTMAGSSLFRSPLSFGPSFVTNYTFTFDGDIEEYDPDQFLSATCEDAPGVNIILRRCNSVVSDNQFAEELIEGFPCSISQIAWLPKTDEWVIHDEFLYTAETNTISIYPECPQNYANRILAKYPFREGWRNKSKPRVLWPISFK